MVGTARNDNRHREALGTVDFDLPASRLDVGTVWKGSIIRLGVVLDGVVGFGRASMIVGVG